MSSIISVDKTFADAKAVKNAMVYWNKLGRTVRLAKADVKADGSVAANIDFLVDKGDEPLTFGLYAGYRVNSARKYDFNIKTFLAKGLSVTKKTETIKKYVIG